MKTIGKETNIPLISIIIPVYNGEYYIQAALDSIFAQDYKNHEIIVVDDGSTDSTLDILQKYPGIRVLRQENMGPASARNLGISAAQGTMIAFLDSDDIWHPNKLSVQVLEMIEHPDIGYILCRMHLFCEFGITLPDTLNAKHYLNDPSAYIPSALLVRKSVLDEVGLFNPQLRTAEDADWFARAKDMGISSIILDMVLLEKRLHQNNISMTDTHNNANLLSALRQSVIRKQRFS